MTMTERCGVCPHEAAQHNDRGWCVVESCRCDRYVAWSSMRKNVAGLPAEAIEKIQQERVAGARAGRLRRQLGAIVDSDLLVSRLMAACESDPMIASRVVEALLTAGLVLVGPNPVSFTQPNERHPK